MHSSAAFARPVLSSPARRCSNRTLLLRLSRSGLVWAAICAAAERMPASKAPLSRRAATTLMVREARRDEHQLATARKAEADRHADRPARWPSQVERGGQVQSRYSTTRF